MSGTVPGHGRRLIHTVPLLAIESSGYAYSSTRLTESLANLGCHVTLASIDVPGHRAVPTHVELFPRSIGPAKLVRSSRMHAWLERRALDACVDIIHSHSLWAMPGIYAARVSARHGVPHVVSPRGTLAKATMRSGSVVKRPFWVALQLPALRKARAFHATSEHEVDDIRRHGFVQPIALLPNGIDLHETPKTVDARKSVLFLGRIHPIKQPENLLRSWAILAPRFPGWELDVAGLDYDSPGYLDEMRRLAIRLGLPRVNFIGELTGGRKTEAYRRAAVYVLPTRSENFGITVAESLAAGTPAVVTKGAPWPELEARGAGWWVDQGVEPLAGALADAMSRPLDELAAMGAAGRRWMAEDFHWERIAAQMLDFYDWLIAGEPNDRRPEFVRTAG